MGKPDVREAIKKDFSFFFYNNIDEGMNQWNVKLCTFKTCSKIKYITLANKGK